jgi:hypothetical protein
MWPSRRVSRVNDCHTCKKFNINPCRRIGYAPRRAVIPTMTELSAYPASAGADGSACPDAGAAVSAAGAVGDGNRTPAWVRFDGVDRTLEPIAA